MGGRTKEFMKKYMNKGGKKSIQNTKNIQNGKFRKGFFAKKTNNK